jgi:5-(hydroxymethyl)furfural/furfural oxidase
MMSCRILASWKPIPIFADHDQYGASHGGDGPVPIRRLPEEKWPPLLQALAADSQNHQLARIEDFNSDFRDGFGALPLSKFEDKRALSAICYLDGPVRERKNLTIATGAEVEGLRLEGRRVTGVAVSIDGKRKSLRAREVVVCAGALRSPIMLQLAGISPAEDLNAAGVSVVADIPGVGRNLHNHQIHYLVAHLKRDAAPPPGQRDHTTATFGRLPVQ